MDLAFGAMLQVALPGAILLAFTSCKQCEGMVNNWLMGDRRITLQAIEDDQLIALCAD